jgi:Ser/Thr protein kinase RdoA (MazF antagonist)
MKVHGLSNDWVEPDWPFLTLAEVDALLRRFPAAGGAKRILSYSPRPFSAASLVATPRGRVFVKRHPALARDRAGLLEEHRLLRYLREHGGHVPAVLADEDGETAIGTGPWTYEVHTVAAGLDLYEQALSWTPFRSVPQARGAGRALAHLHWAAAGYQAQPRRAPTLVASFSIFAAEEPMAALERYLEARPALAEFLSRQDWRGKTETTLLPYHAELWPWLASLAPLWTHNDFHASNLLWSSAAEDAEPVLVIDFGLADRTNAAYDLATAIERNGVRWLALDGAFAEVVQREQILALLNGYEEVRPLTAAEAQAVRAMLPLVHAEFALSEADYFLRVLRAEERARLAWNEYFLGHAAWFGSDHGARLLDALAEWAGRGHRAAGRPGDVRR